MNQPNSPSLPVVRTPAVSLVLGTAAAIAMWAFPSKGVVEALLWGAFLVALWRGRDAARLWVNPAGLAFALVILYTIATLPLSQFPGQSAREFAKLLKLLAGAWALAALCNTPRRVEGALVCHAAGVTLLVLFDMARLAWRLGPDLLRKAHTYEPFLLTHPNVASMLAASACLAWCYFAWTRRANRPALAVSLAAVIVTVLYLFVIASRGPQIAFACTALAIGMLLPGWRARSAWLGLWVILAVLAVAYVERVNPRFADRKSMAGFSDRDKVWGHTWELTRVRPWLGYGYGKSVFAPVYYATSPPRARFKFPHCHQYWLQILFQHGRIGVAIYLAAWSLLGWRLVRQILRQPSLAGRLLPGLVAMLLLLVHLYGLGDLPDSQVAMLMIWLVPAALAVTAPAPRTAGVPPRNA